MHNSNEKTVQITLEREIIPEERYYLIGFVPAEVILAKKPEWFIQLDSKQIGSVNDCLNEHKKYYE